MVGDRLIIYHSILRRCLSINVNIFRRNELIEQESARLMDIHNYIIYLHDLIRDPKMIPKMQIIVLSRLMIDLEIMANLWSAVTMN